MERRGNKMKITLNKQYWLFLFLFYTLIFNEVLVKIISVFQYEDELIAVAALPLFVLRMFSRRKVRDPHGTMPYVVGFLLCSLLGSLYFQYQPFLSAVLPDVLLCSKFWLCIYTAKELFRDFDLQKHGKRVFFHVKLITWLFLVLMFLDLIFDLFPAFDTRYGFESNMLFFGHPISLISSCMVLILICLAVKDSVRNCFFYIGLLSVIMCTTLRSKAAAGAITVLLLYFIIIIRKRKLTFKTFFLLAPIVVLVGWSQIEYYFFELGAESARYQLLVNSFRIANDHFPFGAGFGTYGSHYSSEFYSPIYYKYGLNLVWGLSEHFGNFICDSFWPMILGQSGYIGTVFYIGAISVLCKKLGKLRTHNRFYYVSGLTAMAYMVIDSMTSTAFVHPLAMPIAMWIGILLARIPDSEPVSDELERSPIGLQHRP